MSYLVGTEDHIEIFRVFIAQCIERYIPTYVRTCVASSGKRYCFSPKLKIKLLASKESAKLALSGDAI